MLSFGSECEAAEIPRQSVRDDRPMERDGGELLSKHVDPVAACQEIDGEVAGPTPGPAPVGVEIVDDNGNLHGPMPPIALLQRLRRLPDVGSGKHDYLSRPSPLVLQRFVAD